MYPQIKANILFEDKSLIVFDKPSSMVVNDSNTSPSDTLQSSISIIKDEDDTSEFSMRSGILHRLDKDTSGVLIVAKNSNVFEKLKEQFVKRQVKKHYIGLNFGHLDDQEIVIDAPIKRDPRNRMRMCVHSDGKNAITKIILKKNIIIDDKHLCLTDIYPHTGRTHQIRVHTSSFNHPILGDKIYLTKAQYSLSQTIVSRLMLHALDITFYHPDLEKNMTVTAPLPKEFEEMYSKYH